MLMSYAESVGYLIANSGLEKVNSSCICWNCTNAIWNLLQNTTRVVIIVEELLGPLMKNAEDHEDIMSLLEKDNCRKKNITDTIREVC